MAEFFVSADELPAREVVLIAAALIETLLEDAISGNMLLVSRDRFNELFRNQGAPLHSWSAKTLLAHALGIFSDEMREQMDQARKIRNAFAHAVRPINFEHPTIAAECQKLDCRKMVRPGVSYKMERHDARARYVEACQMMTVHLLGYLDSVIADVKAKRRTKPATFRSKYA